MYCTVSGASCSDFSCSHHQKTVAEDCLAKDCFAGQNVVQKNVVHCLVCQTIALASNWLQDLTDYRNNLMPTSSSRVRRLACRLSCVDTQWHTWLSMLLLAPDGEGCHWHYSTSSRSALVVSYGLLQTCAFIIYTFMSSLPIAFVGTNCFADIYRTQVLFHVCVRLPLMHQLQRDLHFVVTFAIFVTR